MKPIYEAIKVDRGFEDKGSVDKLSLEDFCRIYKVPLKTAHSDMRSATGTALLKGPITGEYLTRD